MKIQFFHSIATIQHSRNAITMLKNRDGFELFSHEDNAQLLWETYKERLGNSEFSNIYFDLNDLIHPIQSLDELQSPFTKEEIDSIIQNLPSRKSPGPDGFNSNFLKKC
jgi:hypothetical protein